MKTRLQLVEGLLNGTLTNEEKAVAEEFPIVLQEVQRRKKLQFNRIEQEKGKAVRYGG